MQRYHPNTILQENRRYRNISFGFGGRTPNENVFVRRIQAQGLIMYQVASIEDIEGNLFLTNVIVIIFFSLKSFQSK